MRIAVGSNDRTNLNDTAPAADCVASAADFIDQRTAGVGDLFGVVEPNCVAVVDSLQRHARDIGTQYLLGYGI